MRVFVRYSRTGEITSVSKVEQMPGHLEHPYFGVDEGEGVLELPNKPEFQHTETLDLHNKYRVDVAKKKLVKK
jgi:hypothetical protein